MDGTFVTEMKNVLSDNMVIEVDGQTYVRGGYKPVFNDPRPEPLTVHTLTALQDYMKSNNDAVDLGSAYIIVDNERHVSLVTQVHGPKQERHTVITASFDHIEPFKFGEWFDQESFLIKARSLFVHTDDLVTVVEYASKVEIKNDATVDDDGVTQSATVRMSASGALTEKRVAPSMVRLRPYRTFPEIDQPESMFLFRLRRTGDTGVKFALFEADGGAWKNTARQSIAEWLKKHEVMPVVLS